MDEASVSPMTANSPHFHYYADLRCYHPFDITTREWRIDVTALDKVTVHGSPIRTVRRYVVEPGRPKLEQA